MADRDMNSASGTSRQDGTLKLVLAVAALFGLLIQMLGNWRALPVWAAILLGIGMLLLGVSAAKIILWDWFRLWINGALARRKARGMLEGQFHAIDDITTTLASFVAPMDSYSLSISMLGAEMLRRGLDQDNIGNLLVPVRLLETWISCFTGRWKLAWSRGGKPARGVILELNHILAAVFQAASALGCWIPSSDGNADEVHGEPPPYAELRQNWREIQLRYNRLVDNFRSVNSACAPYLPELNVFEPLHL